MNPWRIFDEHPRAFSYFKVAFIGAILAIGVTLANNERTDQRVSDLAEKIAKKQADANARSAQKRQDIVEYVINSSACDFRKLADADIAANRLLIKRSTAALADPAATPGTKKRNAKARSDAKAAIKKAIAFKRNRITIPSGFDCKKLPKTPPK